jgi:hypothetical protein
MTEEKVMTTKKRHNGPHNVWTLVLAAAGLFAMTPARAGIILQVQNAGAVPNSTGNTFEIDLTNTGPSAQNIAVFTFELSVTNTNIVFDAVDTDMNTVQPYIFAGNSLDANFSLPFASLNNAQTLAAADFTNSGGDVSVGAGATVGLGRVFFNVLNGAAPGPFTVSVDAFPATGLSDAAGANVPFSASDGTITITGVTPEPSFRLLLPAILLFGFVAYRRQTATGRA